MKYSTTSSAASRRAGSCVIVGIYRRGKLGKAATDIDKASKGLIRKQIKLGDLNGQLGHCRLLSSIDGVKAQRILVVHFIDQDCPIKNPKHRYICDFVGNLCQF